jgi:uncharacterized protein
MSARSSLGQLPRVVLGHGASGTAASMAPYVDGLRASGLVADAINLRRGKAEDAVGPSWTATEALIQSGADRAIGCPGATGLVVGGQSFGGRVASLLAAERPADVQGLVCFSYPLHRPGAPDTWEQRTAHWPRIACPVLLLSGESDPFARLDLLRSAIGLLGRVELVTYPRLGHGLKPVLPDVLERVVAFIGQLEPIDPR